MSQPIPHTHVVFGNVGGTGKTTITAGLADYFASRGLKVLCWNADPLCPGIEEYRGLMARGLRWKLGDLATLTEALEKAAGSAEQLSVIDFGPAAFPDFARWLGERSSSLPSGWQLHLPVTSSRLRDIKYGMRHVLHAHNPPLPVVLWLNQLHGYMLPREVLNTLNLWPGETQGCLSFADLNWDLMRTDFEYLRRSTFTLAKADYKVDKKAQVRLAAAQKELRKGLDGLYGSAGSGRLQPKQTDLTI